ncbi:helix-turn-helix transcriptional regulator [Escherichia coli]|nr:helix-turn-helix transcriptional regulator [Escherichia coli]
MKTLKATPETTNFINCGCVTLKGLELDSFALNIANLLSAVRTFHLLDCARSKELGIEVMEFIHEYALSAASPAQQKQSFPESWLVNLRTQREACGLTTAELARLLDLDEEIIIQWESGEYEPTISMLIPLANILGCDPMWLLTGEVTPPEQPKSESSNTMTHLNKFAPYLAKLFYGRTNTNGDIIAASPLKVHANIFINHCGNSLNMKTLLRLAI